MGLSASVVGTDIMNITNIISSSTVHDINGSIIDIIQQTRRSIREYKAAYDELYRYDAQLEIIEQAVKNVKGTDIPGHSWKEHLEMLFEAVHDFEDAILNFFEGYKAEKHNKFSFRGNSRYIRETFLPINGSFESLFQYAHIEEPLMKKYVKYHFSSTEAFEFWRTWINPKGCSVLFTRMLDIIAYNCEGKQTVERQAAEYVAQLIGVKDINDEVTAYAFDEFTQRFGPLHGCLSRVWSLKHCPWFQAHPNSNNVEEFLNSNSQTFVVRLSEAYIGAFSLDFKKNGVINKVYIEPSSNGYGRFSVQGRSFPDLLSVIKANPNKWKSPDQIALPYVMLPAQNLSSQEYPYPVFA
jgi:hypothetical protein